MANLNVAGFGNTIEILLENFSWESMSVDEETIPGFQVPGTKGKRFSFVGAAPVEFMASSKRDITLSNPSQSFLMKGPDKSDIVYLLDLEYFPQSEGFNVTGTISVLDDKGPDAESGPIKFSQDTMTGELAVGKVAT